MKIKNPRCRHNGFTLIEVLVVIAIIAVLAIVSFTIGPKMQAKAKMSKSVNNMRQIGIMMRSYGAENGDRLPAPREDNTGDNGSTRNPDRPGHVHWHQAILFDLYPSVSAATVTGDKSWWATNEPIVKNPQFAKDQFEPWYPGYAMNFKISENVMSRIGSAGGWFGQSRFLTPLSMIPEPARTPLLMPHWDWHSSNFLVGNLLNSPKDAQNPKGKAAQFMIDGKMNIIFVDGHAEIIQVAKPDGSTTQNNEYVRRRLHLMPDVSTL